MDRRIVPKHGYDYQLIVLAIDMTHCLLSVVDCAPDCSSNPHIAKAMKIATEWNDVFINEVVLKRYTKQGEIL